MKPKTLIFIGPQGSGKGTQISALMTKLRELDSDRSIVEIQTGRGFREMIARQETFADKKVKTSIEAGQLQPDFLTNLLWGQQMLNELDADSHLLIDGFPRNIAQAEVVDEALAFFGRDTVEVINLDTPEDIVIGRMKGRGRADDTDESIAYRLEQYRRETLPVLDFYKNRADTTIHTVNGAGTIKEVQAEILEALGM